MDDLLFSPITAQAEAVRTRRVSPVELTRAHLDRIAKLDPALRAFITVDGDGALAAAETLEREAAAGAWRGPLHGVPLAHKDLCRIEGLPTSCGTRTADYFVGGPPCTAVARLVAAGAVTLGKLNMTELALGPFGDNAHHGDVQNPWRLGHVSGGSSSGSGAAVAAALAAGALGTDTGGSIRLPAASCGVVGLKPTYGRVSRAGVMPLSWSHDHVGPLARGTRDAALLLGVIAGSDPLDATASRRPVPDYLAALGGGAAGLRVGVAGGFFAEDLDATVARALAEAVGVLRDLGAAVEPVAVPDPVPMMEACNNPMVRAESAAVHSRLLKERPDELQPAVRDRLAPGLAVSAYQYLQGQRLRARFTREFLRTVFARVDVLVAPTIPEPAPALADVKAGTTSDTVARMGRFSRLTRPFNTLGLPALSVPCGAAPDGRPVAMQLVGRPFDEATVLRLGDAYERATPWHRRRPPLAASVDGRAHLG
jgi:aspartyl-tRNA(Asn)/glutamyl-tRNA(Gln) amidotransferase subunit A